MNIYRNCYLPDRTTKLNNAKSYNLLKDLTTYLKLNTSIRIKINSYTYSKGCKRSNFLLSKRSAKVIAQNLKKNGISKDRIEWKGYGEDHPIAENENEEGRSKKRRVEFEVIK